MRSQRMAGIRQIGLGFVSIGINKSAICGQIVAKFRSVLQAKCRDLTRSLWASAYLSPILEAAPESQCRCHSIARNIAQDDWTAMRQIKQWQVALKANRGTIP